MTSKFASASLNVASNNDDGWDDVDDNDDGWGDDDDNDLLGMSPAPVKAAAAAPSLMVQPKANLNMQEEDDFFKTFDTKQVPLRSTGGKLAAPKPAAKKSSPPPKITKLKVDASDWDDF